MSLLDRIVLHTKCLNNPVGNSLHSTVSRMSGNKFAVNNVLSSIDINKKIELILSLFDVTFIQFYNLDFETQYHLQHDLFEAMYNVLIKNFTSDTNDHKGISDYIICDLENYKEEHDLVEYAETILKDKYCSNPPTGLTLSKIKKMNAWELIDLDRAIQEGIYGKPIVKRENPFDREYENQ